MIRTIKTDSENSDFIELVKYLDIYLAEKDGEDHSFYDQFNKIDKIKHVIIAYENDVAVCCGAIKEYSPNTMEVKRMYTVEQRRGYGIAGRILTELEVWAKELQFEKCILETGKRQIEAVGLYKKNGYKIIPNYGQYAEMEYSVCFGKVL